jgi:hypothetical protein
MSLVSQQDADFETCQPQWYGDAPRTRGRYLHQPTVVIDISTLVVKHIADDQGRIVKCSRKSVAQRGRLGAIPKVDHQARQGIARPSTPAQVDRERGCTHDEHARQQHPPGREVDRSGRDACRDDGECHGHGGGHDGRPKAAATQGSSGCGRADQRGRGNRRKECGLESGDA